MPDLPRIFAQPNTAYQSNVPQTTPRDFGAGVFGEVEKQAEMFGRIQEAADEAEARRAAQEAKAKIEDAIKQGEVNEVDPDVFHQGASTAKDTIYGAAIGGARNSRVKQKIEDELSPYMIRSSTTIDLTKKKKQVESARGNTVVIMDEGALLHGREQDPAKRAKIETDIAKHLERMRVTGAMSAEEVSKAGIKFLKESDAERVSWMVINTPEKVEAFVNDQGNVPSRTAAQRHNDIQRANEAIREKRVAGERLQKEVVDQARLNILVASETASNNGASLTAQREALLRRTDLPVGAVQWGVDRINHRLNALARGEQDPFFHSDGEVLAHVTKGVLEDPGKWTKGDITRYMGQGLSVKDGQHLIGTLEKAHKGAPAGEGMKSANRFVENYRKLGAFLPASEREGVVGKEKNVTAMMKNDTLAREVMQKIAARPNEDPMKVMNEVMQPYFDQSVKTWGDTVRGTLEATGLVPPFLRRDEATLVVKESSREEQVAARQQLARLGQDITEKNIATVIQQRRKQPAAPAPAQQQTTPAPAPAPGGKKKFDLSDAGKVERFYELTFGRPLPISAKGQSATHDRMGFDHSNGMDIAVNPTTEEGMTLMRYLDAQNIPFIAFDRAKPGQATGPHIHVGAPSPKLATRPMY